MYSAQVNKTTFEIISSDDGFTINGEPFVWDLQKLGDTKFHILVGKSSFSAEVVKADRNTKTFVIRINGNLYNVGLKDRFDLLLEKMGMNNSSAGKLNMLKAPMPGLIIDLKVSNGDVVKQGDILLILEAMKMENVIKSPGEGVVRSVRIKRRKR